MQVPLPCPLLFDSWTLPLWIASKCHGRGHGCPSSCRDGVPGPTAAAAQLPVAVGTGVVGWLESHVPSSLLLLGSLKLWALLPWSGGQYRRPHVLIVFQSTHL